jgi:quinoprotein glucose dehydrogenase
MRLLRAAALVVGIAAVVGAQAPRLERDWPSYGHDAGAQRYSPLKQINTSNVSRLELAWSYDTPAALLPSELRGASAEAANQDEPNAPAAGRGESEKPARPARPAPRQSAATPLVVDGVMYLATMYNRVVALDADTGKEIWVKEIGHTPSTRGIAYWPGSGDIPPQLVFGTGDGSSLLISLNARAACRPASDTMGSGTRLTLAAGFLRKTAALSMYLKILYHLFSA